MSKKRIVVVVVVVRLQFAFELFWETEPADVNRTGKKTPVLRIDGPGLN